MWNSSIFIFNTVTLIKVLQNWRFFLQTQVRFYCHYVKLSPWTTKKFRVRQHILKIKSGKIAIITHVITWTFTIVLVLLIFRFHLLFPPWSHPMIKLIFHPFLCTCSNFNFFSCYLRTLFGDSKSLIVLKGWSNSALKLC